MVDMKHLGADRLNGRPILAFLFFWILACAISWLAFPLAVEADDSYAGRVQDLFGTLAKFGPSIAGVVTVLLFGGGGGLVRLLRSVFDLARPIAVLAVLALPLVATVAGVVGERNLGELDSFDSAAALNSALAMGALYWVGLRTLLGGGLGEELGIRGVALPALLTLTGPRLAALVIGVLWGVWHLPVLVGNPALIWVAQFALTVSLSVIMTFIFLRTGGSVGIAVLFHGAVNGWAAFAEESWIPAIDDLSVWQIIRIAVFLIIALGLLCVRWRR